MSYASAGVEIVIDASDVTVITDKLDQLTSAQRGELMDDLGALGVSQTQNRLANEKTAPVGSAWAPTWRGDSILVLDGHLLGSIHHTATEDEAAWGSNLVYAGVHQYGATIKPKSASRLAFRAGNRTIFAREVTVPPRPYLGISPDNATEIEEAVLNWAEGILMEGVQS